MLAACLMWSVCVDTGESVGLFLFELEGVEPGRLQPSANQTASLPQVCVCCDHSVRDGKEPGQRLVNVVCLTELVLSGFIPMKKRFN